MDGTLEVPVRFLRDNKNSKKSFVTENEWILPRDKGLALEMYP